MSDIPGIFTLGEQWAMHSVGMRTKYGRYPVPPGTEPREGYEDFPVVPQPNIEDMTETQKNNTPLNRADYRARFRPNLPRKQRLDTYTNKRRRCSQ